jgi:DNA-binding transcriptional LysR family regulator
MFFKRAAQASSGLSFEAALSYAPGELLQGGKMKFEDMVILTRVLDAGSMSLAARQLNLSPATVSSIVRRVELEIGVRIFERTTRTLRPSEDGLVLLKACREMLDRWQWAMDQVRGVERGVAGTVHISAPSDTAHQLLTPVLGALAGEHPDLQVVVHSSDVVHHLHRDAMDMALRYGELPSGGLMARNLAECPSVLVASRSYLKRQGHPASLEDLGQHRCLSLKRDGKVVTSWTLESQGEVHKVEFRGQLCGDGLLARRWALEGVGIAYKNLFDVIDDLERGSLVQVLPQYTGPLDVIHAVFPGPGHLPDRVRVLDEAVSAAFKARARRCEAWLAR